MYYAKKLFLHHSDKSKLDLEEVIFHEKLTGYCAKIGFKLLPSGCTFIMSELMQNKISDIQQLYLSNRRKFQLEWTSLDDVHQLELDDGEMTGELGINIFGKIIEGRFGFCTKCDHHSHLGLWSCNIIILGEKDIMTLSLVADDIDTNLFHKQSDDKVSLS